MKKSITLFLVATLLLAGCTELLDSGDGETLKIEINEDIAFEKINDFLTVDEGESFGISMMQEMDSEALAEMGLIESDEDSDQESTVRGTFETTQAWSPDGYHISTTMGIGNGSSSIKKVDSMTQIGTTIYMEVGYEKLGDLCADEEEEEGKENCEKEMAMLSDVKAYSMTTTTTHTELIAAMAEDTQNNGDGMDMMEMLEVFTFTECMGVFTPSTETVDGLQIFDVTMVDMEDSMTPNMALCLFDTDDSDSISFEEFTVSDDTDESDVDEMRTVFDNADADADGELDSVELVTFIEAVDSHDDEDDHMHGDEDEHMNDGDESGEMPDMSVAFNNAGEIEYFSMSADGNEMKMFVLTDNGVESIFANVDAGELVALPFLLGNEYDMDNGGTFYCDNGNDIPMDYVNDGDNDCGDNSDENVDRGDDGDDSDSGNDHGDDHDEMWTFHRDMSECDSDADGMVDFDELDACVTMDLANDGHGDQGVYGLRWMFDLVDADEDGMLDSDEFEDFAEMTSGEPMMVCYDRYADEIDSSITSYEECEAADLWWIQALQPVNEGEDDDHSDDSFIDAIIEEWMAAMDSNGDNNITWEEHDAFVSNDEGYESDEDRNETIMLWADYDLDSNGGLDEYELAELLAVVMVEYDEDGDDSGTDDRFLCDNGMDIPMDYVNDGVNDCGDNSDENVDMGDDGDETDMGDGNDHGDSDGNTFYIETTQDVLIPFEGDMSDYKIELTTCRDVYNSDTQMFDTTCGESVMSIAISDAGENSDIVFHDADNSGTISLGDMIHIGETTGEWNTVRLYSVSADAYSDENPVFNTPGFTGLVGMLALLGAAFIRRNE